jgi:hypothetical protein
VDTRSGEQLFTLRTWLESPGDTRTMRGRIDHIGSGRRRYFSNFGDLCDFVAIAQTLPPAAVSEADVDESADLQDPA